MKIEQLMAFEEGELSEEETVDLFQDLVSTGTAWVLQGCYGRLARHLIDVGLVTE